MFCKKCGNKIDDGAVFCPACGTDQSAELSVSSGANISFSNNSQERDAILAQATNCLPVMTSMKENEDKIESLDDEIEKYEKKGKIIYAIFIYIVCFLIVAIILQKTPNFIQLLGMIAIVPIPVMYRKKKLNKAAELKAQKQECENQINVLKQDATLSWLPYDYRDATSFAMILSYLENMRANTLKEAINLLETEKHQARVELMTALSMQSAEDAATSAKTAAGAAAASAFFSLFK